MWIYLTDTWYGISECIDVATHYVRILCIMASIFSFECKLYTEG